MAVAYREGTLFLVPLRSGGFGRGVIARMAPKGGVLFGYFFGPKFNSREDVATEDPSPHEAVYCARFGDLGLLNGTWPVLSEVAKWDRLEWPMPSFRRQDPLGKFPPVRVTYSDDDPALWIEEQRLDQDADLPQDGMSGFGAIEIRLTNLLADQDHSRELTG